MLISGCFAVALSVSLASLAVTGVQAWAAQSQPSNASSHKPAPDSVSGQKGESQRSANQGQVDPVTEGWLIPAAEKLPMPVRRAPLNNVKTNLSDDTGANFDSVVSLVKQDRSVIDLRAIGDQTLSYRRKVTDRPQDSELRIRLAGYLYLAGDLEGAASELKRAIALNPESGFGHAFLAHILDDVGDREQASSEYRRAIDLSKDSADPHLLYADSLANRGDISGSINEFRRAIALKPSADAYAGLAEALLLVHDSQGAIKAARHAVSADPGSSSAHVALTEALVLAGETHASLRTARQAVLLNPSSAESHIALGRSLYAKGDRTGAVDEFEQAVSLDPLNAQARNDLGYALYGKGDMLSAINEFRLALRLNPHLSEARNNLEIAIHGLTGRKKP